MASITIRNLDQNAKQALKVRAAQNGRSMEEEARFLLTQDAHHPITANSSLSVAHSQSLQSKSILFIIGGGIAAYKALELIRRLKEQGAQLHIIMTKAAEKFVTPLSASALSGCRVYTDLFSHSDEHDIGHIRLARQADLILLAPATANRMAKAACGIADDLAGAALMAARCPIVFAPAMNPAMWQHKATQRNLQTLSADGCYFVGPEVGEMAESGEHGRGRMSEPLDIVAAVKKILRNIEDNKPSTTPLHGKHFIVTAGPTHEPIDPVRYIANRSSGKQGYAIAAALQQRGARVTLVSGPVAIKPPQGVHTIYVETAQHMLEAVKAALPADGAIFVAAVADWRSKTPATEKLKKATNDAGTTTLEMVENPDILATIAHASNRPRFVVGFAAETTNLQANAQQKLIKKGADLIILNDVKSDAEGQSVMGSDNNTVYLIDKNGSQQWPKMDKQKVGEKLADYIANILVGSHSASQ